MKRFSVILICLLLLLVSAGCSSTELKTGLYFLTGDCEDQTICDYVHASTPYVKLNFDDKSFAFGEGLMNSYAEIGNFKIKGDRITAKTQNTTFVFEIKGPSLIVLTDCGEYEPFAEYESSEFGHHFDI